MIDRYAGWQPLIEAIKALSERYGVKIYTQPKAGFLRASAPFSAPSELLRRLDRIEEQSSVTCQFCGRSGAAERSVQEWIYTICPNSKLANRADGAVGTSCAL